MWGDINKLSTTSSKQIRSAEAPQCGTSTSFARKFCRAYRTVYLNSALVLAGILILDIRVSEMGSLYTSKKGVRVPALGDRDVEGVASALDRTHPAEQMEIELGSLVDEEQYHSHHLNYEVRIFTDGSRIEGIVGAPLSIWKGEAEIKTLQLALSLYCTV